MTVLHYAAQNGDAAVMRLLLAAGANVHARGKVSSVASIYVWFVCEGVSSGVWCGRGDDCLDPGLHASAGRDGVVVDRGRC
jgi:ankyrin repeat protein